MQAGVCLKNLVLLLSVSLLSSQAFAARTQGGVVTPSASFGVATDVRVGSMTTATGQKIDLVVARNSKGDIFLGKSTYVPGVGTYWTAPETNLHVRGSNGARSAGTVAATIRQEVPKKKVIAQILEKARIGGRALGKGAASVGRFVGLNTPYGRAFALATAALEGSKYFWSDDENDFVKPADDETYIVFSPGDKASGVHSSMTLDKNSYKEMCESQQAKCQTIAVVRGYEAANQQALAYCKSIKYKSYSGNEYNYDGIGWSGFCEDNRRGVLSGSYSVKVAKWVDYMPITEDEFFDEAVPDADKDADNWVKTSEVKPTDAPKIEIPAGSVAQTDPYTDPKDGKTKQTRWDFDGKGKVRETTIERPDLTPNSPEAPSLKPNKMEDLIPEDKDKDKEKDPEAEEASRPKSASDVADLCEKNPDIMACDKQPEAPEEEPEFEIPHETHDLFFAPDTLFPTNGTCPAPVSFTLNFPYIGAKSFQFDTMPICETASRLRGFIIAMAWLVVATMCLRALSSKD